MVYLLPVGLSFQQALLLHSFWSLRLLINGFDQHQSFHFKTAHLIFKYFICFCIGRILSSLPSPSPSQFNIGSNDKNQICFLTLLQIQVLNKNLTDNPGEDNPSLQYESRCSNIQIIMM